MEEFKNREGGKNPAKGVRLQKLRAALFLIETLERDDVFEFYAYLEHQGDITTTEKTNAGKKEYIEEDKNYDPDTSFTIKSKQILNTLNIFLDLYIEKKYSEHCYFGFYTTNSIGNEKKLEDVKTILDSIDGKSILEKLISNNYNDDFIDKLKDIILEYYKNDYQNLESTGNYSTLEKFTLEQWKNFFSKINWSFESDDISNLEKDLIDKIEKSKFFNISHEGKANNILHNILDELDRKIISDDKVLNGMHVSEVKNIFLEIGAKNIEHEEDPVWKMWASVDMPEDKRNLHDKVVSFYSDFDMKIITNLSRKACKSKIVEESARYKKSFLSMKYRVYEKCLDNIVDFSDKPKTEKTITNFIEDLKKVIHIELKELELIYNHKYNTNDFIEGIIIDLIDSCYLNFDGN